MNSDAHNPGDGDDELERRDDESIDAVVANSVFGTEEPPAPAAPTIRFKPTGATVAAAPFATGFDGVGSTRRTRSITVALAVAFALTLVGSIALTVVDSEPTEIDAGPASPATTSTTGSADPSSTTATTEGTSTTSTSRSTAATSSSSTPVAAAVSTTSTTAAPTTTAPTTTSTTVATTAAPTTAPPTTAAPQTTAAPPTTRRTTTTRRATTTTRAPTTAAPPPTTAVTIPDVTFSQPTWAGAGEDEED